MSDLKYKLLSWRWAVLVVTTSDKNLDKDIEHKCPIRKVATSYNTIETVTKGDVGAERDETHKWRRKYAELEFKN